MPIYEYLCHACGFGKDVLQKLSDTPLTDCPECGKAQYRKQISAAGFRLKGQGWYETDFKTGAKKNLVGDAKFSNAEKGSEGNAKKSSSATSGS
ncbi:MAG: FmdB family zinc ribbon protein [Pseudomonadales bacterium]